MQPASNHLLQRSGRVVSAALAATIWLVGGPAGTARADTGDAGRVAVAVFDVDATPPVGVRMAYGPAIRPADMPLRCRGLVLLGAGEPIVLCCVDWIGIGNEGHSAFRAGLAEAAGTRPERVAVHATHAHDAPHCDFTAERLVKELGSRAFDRFDGDFPRAVIARAAAAIRAAVPAARAATHWGFGRAPVAEVASNRRILGDDGKVWATRTSKTTDPALRAKPEGLIDPEVACLVFWSDDAPLAVITSYACHPQSYYRTGVPSPDFPGIARFIRSQDVPTAVHVHFDGAGGNVTAGKYNDGSHANRMTLALRLAAGMRQAFDAAVKLPLAAADVGWSVAECRLEPASHLDADDIATRIRAAQSDRGTFSLPEQLAWLTSRRAGRPVLVTCLRVGTARMLHLPGESFVEYQLAARRMRPDLGVMVAAYGDLGPGYVGTAVAYDQGGYETQPTSSFVDSRAEPVLLEAIGKLLETQP